MKFFTLFLALFLALSPFSQVNAEVTPGVGMIIPITGTINVVDTESEYTSGNIEEGTLTIKDFRNDGGAVVADGVLSGTVGGKTFATDVVGVPVTVAKTPVGDEQEGCNILNLDMGAIDQSVLGLEIHVDPISQDIGTASTVGVTGGLLSDLLCTALPELDLTDTDAVVTFLLSLLAVLG